MRFQITRTIVEQYILFRQVSGQDNADVSAMKKGERMMEANVDALSFYQDKDQFFFTGIVSAEMKNVAYITRIRVHAASGNVLNSECDCPAGEGPTATCKHIVAVLLLLINFISTGTLAVTGSCTDQLQTFKRPQKPHKGGPVPAHKMGKGLPIEDDDPRPAKYRNVKSYNDDLLYNATVNYAANSGVDVSWRYHFKGAHLNIAQRDHDYLEQPFCSY